VLTDSEQQSFDVSVTDVKLPIYAGIDVGGTGIKIGIVDDNGRVLAYQRILTHQEKGPEDGVKRIHQCLTELVEDTNINWDQIEALGLGTPGTMDIPAGMLLELPNMSGWNHFRIRDAVSEACQKPVAFVNDANAAAYGEFWVGTGAENDCLIMLTLGTGLGGGIIIRDISLDGEHSHGSECGHVIVDTSDAARMCPCGLRGHMEAYASATSVAKRTTEGLPEYPQSSLHAVVKSGNKISSLDVFEHAEKRDAYALQIVKETAEYLAIGITSLVHTIDPDIVVLGGAMDFGGRSTDTGKMFLGHIRSRFSELTFPVLAENTIIDFATLGSDSGFIGAAGVARAQFGQN